MSAALAAVQQLKRRAFSLGAVKAFDNAMQFLLPVVLVRCLDTATFGEYRLIWLVFGTVIVIATFNMVGGLYFFLPRAEPLRKRLYVHQTLLFLAVSGLVCAVAVSPLNPLLPEAARPLEKYGLLMPAFVLLWVVGMMLDYLPTIEERIGWQAYATVGVSVLRVVLLGLGAWYTGDLGWLLWLLVAVGAVKLLVLLAYVKRFHGFAPPWFERECFSGQFRHTAPFGVSNALYGLRAQADQWVAAALFALHSFAAFSIGTVFAPMVNIFRQAVLEAFLPSMSRMQAAGDVKGMLELSSRANVMVAFLLYPMLAIAFVFADEIVTIIYTANYREAAPVMRVYIVGLAAMVIELGSIMLLLRQGAYYMGMSVVALVLSISLSWYAAQRFGLAGAAVGSVAAVYLDRLLAVRRISVCSGIPVRRLQDWPRLAMAALLAGCAALLAWGVVSNYLFSAGPLLRLTTGAALVLATCLWVPALAGLRKAPA